MLNRVNFRILTAGLLLLTSSSYADLVCRSLDGNSSLEVVLHENTRLDATVTLNRSGKTVSFGATRLPIQTPSLYQTTNYRLFAYQEPNATLQVVKRPIIGRGGCGRGGCEGPGQPKIITAKFSQVGNDISFKCHEEIL